MTMRNPLILLRTRPFFVLGILLTGASGFGCQQPEAKSPDPSPGGANSSAPAAPAAPATAASPHAAEERAAQGGADAWLALIDQKQFEQSWAAAAPIFQSSLSAEKWENAASAARAPLGELSSRKFRAAEYKASLPGAPEGQYVVVYYDTDFAQKQSTTESVTLMKSDGAWKAAGYFVQ
jgi:hypothetical protein